LIAKHWQKSEKRIAFSFDTELTTI